MKTSDLLLFINNNRYTTHNIFPSLALTVSLFLFAKQVSQHFHLLVKFSIDVFLPVKDVIVSFLLSTILKIIVVTAVLRLVEKSVMILIRDEILFTKVINIVDRKAINKMKPVLSYDRQTTYSIYFGIFRGRDIVLIRISIIISWNSFINCFVY